VKGACQVRSEDVVPLLFIHANGEAVTGYAGVVHQDIYPAPLLHCRIYHCIDHDPLSYIGLMRQGLSSLFRYAVNYGDSVLMPLAVVHDDPCSGKSEPQGDRPAEAA
jgi:hypothetical protein